MIRPPANQSTNNRWFSVPSMSFRARLVAINLLITFVAIIGMGYYVYYRAQETNAYLTSQLQESNKLKAEESLANIINEQAATLQSFFHARSGDIALIGSNAQRLLQQETRLNNGSYWDAEQSLSRLPSGSWDNGNSEPASIFIPAAKDLTHPLVSELNTLKYTETTYPLILEAQPEVIAIYFGGVSGETIYYPNVDLAGIVPPDFDVTQRPWFTAANPEQNPQKTVVWSAPYQDAALNGLVVTGSTPVYDDAGHFRGVAAMDMQLNLITEIVSNIHIGKSGYAFVIDKDNRLIAMPQAGYDDFEITPKELPLGEPISKEKFANISDDFFGVLAQVASGQTHVQTVFVNGQERFLVHHQIPEVDYDLAILVPAEEMLAESQAAIEQIAQQTRSTVRFSLLLIAAILAGASFAALIVSNTITNPLKLLTGVAQEITMGNLDARAETRGNDEIGILGETLNTMAGTLSGLIQSLEQRVAERTADLEMARLSSEKRAHDLQTIGEISTVIASEQDLETLLPLITRLVSEKFDFYHTGIFLLDETRQYAVLQAANSLGGQKMLARGHKLAVGETGIVGFVTKLGEPRIALDVGKDAVYFNNPDLPATRSEMALPLSSRGRIIGALDVQSDKPGAFTGSDASTLSILATQISIAIENARLFKENELALSEARSLYSQYVHEAWGSLDQKDMPVGYHQTLTGGKALSKPIETDEIRDAINRGQPLVFQADAHREEPVIVVPVKLRGQIIGALSIKAPTQTRRWSQEEIGLAEAISERLSLALENARLIEDSQRQAIKEQTIGEVTAKIGSSINLRNVLQTAVEELGRFIPGSEVMIRFQPDSDQGEK